MRPIVSSAVLVSRSTWNVRKSHAGSAKTMFLKNCVPKAYMRLCCGAAPVIHAPPSAGLSLAAWRIPGEDLLTFGASRPGVDLGQRIDLGRGETTVGLRSLAQERGGFEVALRRALDDSILNAIERVAAGQHRGLDGRQFAGGDVAGRIGQGGLRVEYSGGQQMRPEVGWRSSYDRVIVSREALGFHEGLASSIGAGCEVRTAGPLPVEGANDGLSFFGGFMNGSVAEIGDLFGVAQRPGCIGPTGLVSGVGRSCGIAAGHGSGHVGVVDHPREAAVANAFKLSIPTRAWQPHLKTDARISGWADDSGDPAEGR